MTNRDPQVDAYIARAQPFARPILQHLRDLVHRACPDVVETRKWHMVAFQQRGILCMMAGFKAHCSLIFWKGHLVDPAFSGDRDDAGRFHKIATMQDLPKDRVLLKMIRLAAKLDAAGAPTPGRGVARPKRALVMPDDLRDALSASPKAQRQFAAFSPSCKREYVEWITGAKRAETRAQRLATAVVWIAAGKHRNWKYESPRAKTATA
jgi:uncharacterized protein YdeI (YjbR/CyaY-like superfamily)